MTYYIRFFYIDKALGPLGPGGEPPPPAAPGAGRAQGVQELVGDGAVWLWLAFWRIVGWGT